MSALRGDELLMARGPKPKYEARCPDHPGAKVKSDGLRRGPAGSPPRRRWECVPMVGAKHWFTTIDGPVPVPVFSPAPACPEHPGSKVVRNGRYATSTDKKRQKYRCTPAEDDALRHDFVPDLARAHVHTGEDSCAECEELRGTHRGDRTVARRHSWSGRLVAESLKELAAGKSYAAVGRDVRRRTNRTRTRKRVRNAAGELVDRSEVQPANGKKKRAKYAGSELSANAWHIAADWVEVFSPVLWDAVEPNLQAAENETRVANDALVATQARARRHPGLRAADLVGRGPSAGEYRSPLRKPMVLMLDDIPIQVKEHKAYYVLVAAQVEWAERPGLGDGVETLGRGVKLRLVRGYGTNSNEAWKLLFAELGYRPDFIVADRGKGILKAARDAFGDSVPVIPSLFHMRAAVEKGLLDTPGTRADPGTRRASYGQARVLKPELVAHLDGLRRVSLTSMTAEEWSQWWDDLFAILRNLNLPIEKVRTRRREYETLVADLLPVYRAYPQLPVSTGGLEVAMRQRIKPVLTGRAQSFGNLERVNRLFDLVVARDNGAFDDLVAVTNLLREDGEANNGWATPLREVADVRSGAGRAYSSLRDQQLVRQLASKAVTP